MADAKNTHSKQIPAGLLPVKLSRAPALVERKEKRRPRRRGGVIKSAPLAEERHPILTAALDLVDQSSTKIESKDRAGRKKVVYDQTAIEAARSILSSAKTEYCFRVVTITSLTIASNTVSAALTMSPLASTEWSAIAALFDWYRVDEVITHFCPVLVAGNTGANWSAGGYVVGNHYSLGTSLGSYDTVWQLSESHVEPMSQCFIVGSTSTNATSALSSKLVWRSVTPQFVVTSTTANAEWLDTADAWPGSVQFVATVNGTNGDMPMQAYQEFFIRARLRR